MANANAVLVVLFFSAILFAVAIVIDVDVVVFVVPFDCIVIVVTYVANALLTGANTNSRTLNLRNKGQDGSGSTVVVSKAFVSGVNAVAFDETVIILSDTAAN